MRGSYSEGFRAPGLRRVVLPIYGNPKLRPEISSEYDGGFTKTFGEFVSFTATYFSRRVHSLIVSVPVPVSKTNPLVPRPATPDASMRRESKWRLRSVPITASRSAADLPCSMRPTRARTGRCECPKRSAFGLAQYERKELLLPRDKMTLSVAYTFVGDRDDITQYGKSRSHVGYHRFDATATYDARVLWGRLTNEEVFARVSNLFDRHYAEEFGFPSPPVNFVAGIKLEFE